jgi:hypothetical protein
LDKSQEMATKPVDDRGRSLEQALDDLNASYQKRPSAGLARMIRQLEIEIAYRKGAGTTQAV